MIKDILKTLHDDLKYLNVPLDILDNDSNYLSSSLEKYAIRSFPKTNGLYGYLDGDTIVTPRNYGKDVKNQQKQEIVNVLVKRIEKDRYSELCKIVRKAVSNIEIYHHTLTIVTETTRKE